MKYERALIAVAIIIFILVLSYAVTLGAMGAALPPPDLRLLAKAYLWLAINPWVRELTVMSPEAVTSIVWDFRGLDTFFETAVLYLAIIGTVAIYRGIYSPGKKASVSEEKGGMSPIAKSVTKITLPIVIAVAVAIALHGHLTPGGGFQGGSTAAVILLLVLVVFSLQFSIRVGITKGSMLALRSTGLLGIAVTSILVLILGLLIGCRSFIFQNQPKAYAPIGMPAVFDGMLVSGTLILFNIFECLAVAAGLTLTFILVLTREEDIRSAMKGDKHE